MNDIKNNCSNYCRGLATTKELMNPEKGRARFRIRSTMPLVYQCQPLYYKFFKICPEFFDNSFDPCKSRVGEPLLSRLIETEIS